MLQADQHPCTTPGSRAEHIPASLTSSNQASDSARDSAHIQADWLDTLGAVHMFPFFIGGLIFVPLGAAMAIFRKRWSALSSRLENYANVPETKRRAKPLNYLVVGIVWALVGVAWIILALLNQPWR